MLTGAADGSTVVDRKYDLGEVPILVRAGAIIPSRPVRTGDTIGVAARQYGELIFSVYPGSTSGSTDVYEDDGESTRYVDGKFAYSSASYSRSSDSGDLKFQISTKGTYESLPAQRKISLRIVNGAPVSSISINGEKADIPYQRYPGNAPSWTYEGATATTVIALPAQATATTMTVDITFTDTDVDTAGIRGRISRALAAKHSLDAIRKTPGAHAAGYGKLDAVAVAGDVLARAAGSSSSGDWKTLAQQLGGKSSSMFNDAIAEVAAVKLSGASGANRMKYLAGLLEGM